MAPEHEARWCSWCHSSPVFIGHKCAQMIEAEKKETRIADSAELRQRKAFQRMRRLGLDIAEAERRDDALQRLEMTLRIERESGDRHAH